MEQEERNKLQEILERYRRGQLDKTEKSDLFGWLARLNLTDKQGDNDLPEQQQMRSWAEIEPKLARQPRVRQIARIPWLGIAAAVLLAAPIIGYLLKQNASLETQVHSSDNQQAANYTVITTGMRQVKRIVLPDSSIVWLNAFSELHIPQYYGRDAKRTVHLIEGEAYFEVTADQQKPFAVHSKLLTTEVLGTAFNVSDYQAAQKARVTVTQGKVRVSDNQAKQEFGLLTANKQLEYQQSDGQVAITNTKDAQRSLTWREGSISLEEAAFPELALVLRNVYGVTLQAETELLNNGRFSVTIKTSRSLAETMKLICSLHHSQYRREGNVITLF